MVHGAESSSRLVGAHAGEGTEGEGECGGRAGLTFVQCHGTEEEGTCG